MQTWKKAIKEEGIWLGSKKQGLEVECLAFADNTALLGEDKEET